MTEQAINELRALAQGLEVRISLLDAATASYFEKDRERLRRLIESLTEGRQER